MGRALCVLAGCEFSLTLQIILLENRSYVSQEFPFLFSPTAPCPGVVAALGQESPLDPLDMLRANVPGEPGLDYPVHSAVQVECTRRYTTSFAGWATMVVPSGLTCTFLLPVLPRPKED
jgi:hypothetical protein